MNICSLLLIIPLALAIASVRGAAQPMDVEGWRAARWNMTEAELEHVFGENLGHLPGRWIYGNAYATRALEGIILGDQGFRAIFQMNVDSDRLQQVLLEPLRRPGQEAVFRSTLGELRATYGPPSKSCAIPRSGGGPLSVDLWWKFKTTTVHLTFFDFYTRAMAFEDPNVDPDPLKPYYKTRRNNPQFLPRRALVRFHATTRSDLMSKACRSEDR